MADSVVHGRLSVGGSEMAAGLLAAYSRRIRNMGKADRRVPVLKRTTAISRCLVRWGLRGLGFRIVEPVGDPSLTMEIELLGWPSDGPTLRLDHRRFSYAGKFVMSNTGKAVVREETRSGTSGRDDRTEPDRASSRPREDGRSDESDEPEGGRRSNGRSPRERADDRGVIAAVAFNEDRTDPETLWLRYITVREDRRGEGIGPRLLEFIRDRAHERGYERVRIAVNNPFAYEACYRSGFGYTGRRTGLAELVLEHPADRSAETYQQGLDEFRERDLSEEERSLLARRCGSDPP